MKCRVNGEEKFFPDQISLEQLILEMGLKDLRFAIALNREVIPRSELSNTLVQEGDAIEIVHAVGGG